jgi:hypothetical protein
VIAIVGGILLIIGIIVGIVCIVRCNRNSGGRRTQTGGRRKRPKYNPPNPKRHKVTPIQRIHRPTPKPRPKP